MERQHSRYRAAPIARGSNGFSGIFCATAYPSVREIAVAALFAAAATTGTLSRVTRVVGPETLRAAAIFPEASKMGAAMQREPK